ncbi:hypothetical protein MTO96_038485 [Rhipicephalus appendiculatus]
MAMSKRQKRLGEDEESDGSNESQNEDTDSEQDELVDTEVNVDFEARTPDDSDFHGIKRLLQQLFLKARVNLSDLTNLILGTKLLNVTESRQRECVQQIVTLLRDQCRASASGLAAKFDEYFTEDGYQIGLVISERFVNIPPRIALPLYDALARDVEAAKAAGKKYDFTHLLVICKQYKVSENDEGGAVFANAEEELFEEEAELQFEYNVTPETGTAVGGDWKEEDEEMKQIRKVLVIPTTKWARIMDKLKGALQ